MTVFRPLGSNSGQAQEVTDADYLLAPSVAITEGATTPNPGTSNALVFSTTALAWLRWNGTIWTQAGANDVKTSALTALTFGNVADDDLFPVVDTSATATKSTTTAVLRDKMAAPQKALMPSGAIAETCPGRTLLTNIATLTTQRPYMTSIWLEAGTVVTSITYFAGTTAGATMTHTICGLFDASRNLLRQTTDDTTTTWTASTSRTFTLSSTYTITASGLYYIGICVTATTVPSLYGQAAISQVSSLAPIRTGISASTAITTTMPNPAGAISGGAAIPYAYLS